MLRSKMYWYSSTASQFSYLSPGRRVTWLLAFPSGSKITQKCRKTVMKCWANDNGQQKGCWISVIFQILEELWSPKDQGSKDDKAVKGKLKGQGGDQRSKGFDQMALILNAPFCDSSLYCLCTLHYRYKSQQEETSCLVEVCVFQGLFLVRQKAKVKWRPTMTGT